ncbi:MAG: hypothetical protein HQK84_08835, partial [Nitrospinae bacterium]|nr:hypothetical protein [Nitrospinota bacterium]
KGYQSNFIYIILTGSVEYIHPDEDIHNKLTVGSFIGVEYLFYKGSTLGTWRAISHVTVQKIPLNFLKVFLEKNDLFHSTKQLYDNIGFLKKTNLLGEDCSYVILNEIVKVMKRKEIKKGDTVSFKKKHSLFLINKGSFQINNTEDKTLEAVKTNNFFGEHTFFSKDINEFKITALEDGMLYCIADYPLLKVPIIQWKMLEMYAKRKKNYAF